MATRVEFVRATLDRPLRFESCVGPVQARLQRVTLQHSGARVRGFEIDVEFEPMVGVQVLEAGLFETDAGHRTEALGDGLDPERPHRVTLFLAPGRLAQWFPGDDLAAEVRQMIGALSGDEGSALLDAGLWTFISVGQAVPGRIFEVGFRHRRYGRMPDGHLLPARG